jgi:site-specific DNA-cytosine methylase
LMVKCNAASDRKTSARKFICENHEYTHLLSCADDHALGQGDCSIHGCFCQLGEMDLVVAGLPCHPFTRIRNKRSDGEGRSGPIPTHPDYNTVFESFFQLLRRRQPWGFVVEETDAFIHIIDAAGANPTRRWLDKFLESAAEAGYSCRAMLYDSSMWVDWPRRRPARPHHTFQSQWCHVGVGFKIQGCMIGESGRVVRYA